MTSKTQIDKLGDRLRRSAQVSEADLASFQAVRQEYAPALDRVQESLRNIGLEPTGRLKTIGTVVDKLGREGTRLSTIQDIAGTRVVVNASLTKQDQIVQDIKQLFPENRLTDRRANPSYGYRAVHVVVMVTGKPVEIQVRTNLQDLWAQLFEGLADKWGRGIRYGEPLDDPEQPIEPEASYTRQQVIDLLISVAQNIANLEELRVTSPPELDPKRLGLRHPMLRLKALRLNRRIRKTRDKIQAMEMAMGQSLKDLLEGLESEPK